MAGRNAGRAGGGSRGNGRGGGARGHGRSYNNNKNTKVGLCKDLEANIFDFGTKTSADLMRTRQEKIVQYVATKYGGDIANKLKNRTQLVIPVPDYSSYIKARHTARVLMVRSQQDNMILALTSKRDAIAQQIAAAPDDVNLSVKLAKVENEIIQLEYEKTQEVEVYLRISFRINDTHRSHQQPKNTTRASVWSDHRTVHTATAR